MFSVAPLSFIKGGTPHLLLKTARQEGLWRPTAVALLRCGDKYCVTKHITNGFKENGEPRKRKVTADIPKGGVDGVETAEAALIREIGEEVCLPACFVLRYRFLGYALVPFNKNNQDRDGYKKGKLYLIYEVVVSRPVTAPGRNHRVVGVSWRSDFWNHFKPKSKKRKIFSQSKFRAALIHARR